MPYSYSRLFAELTGRNFENRPVFEPPDLDSFAEADSRVHHRAIHELR